MPDIDNLTIKIKAEADSARKSLNGLIGDLRDLKNANKNAFNGEGFDRQARQLTNYERAVKNAAREFAANWSVSSREGTQTVQQNFKALIDDMLSGFKNTDKLFHQLSDSVKTHAKFVDETKTQYKDLLEYVRNTNSAVTGDVGKIRLGFDSSELGDDYKRLSAIAGKAFVASDKGVGTGDFENYITELNEKLGNIIPVGNTAADTFRNFTAVLQDARDKTMSYNEALSRGSFGKDALDESINAATEQLYNAFQNNIPEAIETTDQEVKKLADDFSFLDGVRVHGMGGEFIFNEGELVPVREEMERIAELADEIRVATSDTGPVLHAIPEELMSPQQLAEAQAQMQAVTKETEKTLSFSERIRQAWERIKNAFGSARANANGVSESMRSGANAAQKLSDSTIKIENPIKNIKTSISNVTKGLKKSFSTFLKYSIGVRSTYALINKIRSGLIEGLKSIVQYSEETNQSISMLRNSFTQFKNSVAAAVTPIINTFAPAINMIIELCTRAVNAINQLISALLGRDTWIKAKKGTEDYAKSLNKASKAAKNGLRSFDELKLITTNSGGGSGNTSAADMFETVAVESKWKDLAARIRAVIQPIIDDFKSLWKHITEGNWFAAGQDVNSIITKITNWLTEAIDGVDWEDLGEKIGEFLSGLDWADILYKWLKLKFKIWEAIAKVIWGSFKTAPLETAFLLLFGMLKFTGVGKLIGARILSKLSAYIAGTTAATTLAGIGTTIATGILGGAGAAIIGFWAGTSLAKWLMGDESPEMTGLEIAEELIDGFKKGDIWEALGEWWKDLWDGLTLYAKDKWNYLFNSELTAPSSERPQIRGSLPKSYNTIGKRATGGFVPNSWTMFMAGENGIPEMLGTVGGKTAVAGGVEITGIKDAIYATNQQEMELMRQQNALLQGILQKEFGITTSDIGRAAQSYNQDYKKRTGRPAYT